MEQVIQRQQSEAQKRPRGNPRIREVSRATQWKPGTSGNPRGRTPEKLISDALRGIYDNPANLKKFVLAAHRRALKGHPKFWEMIVDRLEGKVPQQVQIAGKITHEITEEEKRTADECLAKLKAYQDEDNRMLLLPAEGSDVPEKSN